MLQKLLWLSLAGAGGTVSRFALSNAAAKIAGDSSYPLGTFVVNVVGSFLFGVVYALAQRRLSINHETGHIILTGFIGAFTTFSALAFETAKMMKASQWGMAIGNVTAQVLLGILALVIGVSAARSL